MYEIFHLIMTEASSKRKFIEIEEIIESSSDDSSDIIEINDFVNTKKEKETCKYGSKCYRKNPDHLSQFFHPLNEKAESFSVEKSSKKTKLDTYETSNFLFNFYLTKIHNVKNMIKINSHPSLSIEGIV